MFCHLAVVWKKQLGADMQVSRRTAQHNYTSLRRVKIHMRRQNRLYYILLLMLLCSNEEIYLGWVPLQSRRRKVLLSLSHIYQYDQIWMLLYYLGHLLQLNCIRWDWSNISTWTPTCSCLCLLIMCTALVSRDKTETNIDLNVSLGPDICSWGKCVESEGTDIPLELEKRAGFHVAVCPIQSGFTFIDCWCLCCLQWRVTLRSFIQLCDTYLKMNNNVYFMASIPTNYVYD